MQDLDKCSSIDRKMCAINSPKQPFNLVNLGQSIEEKNNSQICTADLIKFQRTLLLCNGLFSYWKMHQDLLASSRSSSGQKEVHSFDFILFPPLVNKQQVKWEPIRYFTIYFDCLGLEREQNFKRVKTIFYKAEKGLVL